MGNSRPSVLGDMMNKLKVLTVGATALFLAGCQTVAYVPSQQVHYDAYGRPYTALTQTPVVVDNSGQVAGAALMAGVVGLAAGAAIANNNRSSYYYNRPYYGRPYYNHHRYYR